MAKWILAGEIHFVMNAEGAKLSGKRTARLRDLWRYPSIRGCLKMMLAICQR